MFHFQGVDLIKSMGNEAVRSSNKAVLSMDEYMDNGYVAFVGTYNPIQCCIFEGMSYESQLKGRTTKRSCWNLIPLFSSSSSFFLHLKMGILPLVQSCKI